MEIIRLDSTYVSDVRKLYTRTFIEDGPDFIEHYFSTYLDIENVIGLVEEDTLLCMLHLNPYQVMWQGQLYDTSYVVAVATGSDHRRKGYMRRIVNWTLQERYKSGEVFSLLMPIDSTYYDQFGYGFIQDIVTYQFRFKDLSRGVLSRLAQNYSFPWKELSPDESIQLLPIYNHYKRQFNLSHNRGMRAFDTLIKEVDSEGGKVVIVPDGYLIYYVNDIEGKSEQSVFIRESAYTSPEGFYNIMSYVGSIAGNSMVEWQMPSKNPLKHLVSHREGHLRTEKPFMMARIINVLELLMDMAEVIGDCMIKVTDGQIFENNGVYKISGGSVSRVDAVQISVHPDVTIDVESLAQWLFGYESLENLSFVRESVVVHRDIIYYPELPVLNYFNEFV